ncbi:hypothetical protein [Amnibacterium sp.]|uniref:hypothetical protein n=1 Tax=Amnibacterium sp. TaxID=1872496 RepID=UPI00260FD249|nr:hypothetical protein [Amnibacterium sp.]MCU1472039.1 hypothetical protein [Amnibacterium sp.]
MTLWQDQSSRGSRNGTAVDTARAGETREDGQPLSRRAARERERRAAEALAQGQAHPSGVVDFDGHDFSNELHADQEIPVQNTADIWAALARRADTPPAQPVDGPHTGDLARFRSGIPEAPTRRTGPVPASPMTGELLERVRDAVLREHEAEPLPTVRTPVQQPPLSRRELRRRQAEQTTEDGMPAAWFSDEQGVPAAFAGYDDAPTVAMAALDRAELEAQTPMTAPVNLPQFFAEPQGDDSLTFSNPVPLADPDPLTEVAEAEPEFIEPQSAYRGRAWSQVSDDFAEPAAFADPVGYAEPPTGYAEPPAAFGPEQVGPPSEVTDLAGFEALIRRARSGQPQGAPEPMFKQAEQPRQALPWADDEDDAQDYTGLLGRPVQGSNGSANALILSGDPQPDLTQAVNSTGDLFITGSLNLPRSLAQTGATAEHYDSLDIDRLFEASQDEPAAGVAPVRASRAVSGTGSTRAIIGARRARGNVLPTVLAIIAGAMAVGVVTLLVGSWVLKLF